jgi:hypothetical protein
MQEGALALKNLSHEDAHRLGESDNRQEKE